MLTTNNFAQKLFSIFDSPSKYIKWAISVIIPLLLFAAIMVYSLPYYIAVPFRYDFTIIVILISLVFYFAYSIKNWPGTLIGLAATLTIFALPLIALWVSGFSEPNILAGLFPWSDASGYLQDARNLLEGGTFTSLAARRPLFAGLLSVILWLTGKNLQMTLAILVAVNAVACYLAIREIQKTHGIIASVFTMLILFFYYRRFAGATLTENIGFALGVLGFALLWRAGWQHKKFPAFIGLIVITIALNARAGAFFILPFFIIWASRIFRDKSRLSWSSLGWSSGAVIAGFLLSSVLFKALVLPQEGPYANFSYVVYGQAVGGKGWNQFKDDHPEVMDLSPAGRAQRLYELSFQAIQEDPTKVINATLKSWAAFFSSQKMSVFVYLGGENANLNRIFMLGLYLLSIIGLYLCIKKIHDPLLSLLGASVLGILISVPFVPPWDADKMRAYAVTILPTAILPAIGGSFLIGKIKSLPFLLNPKEAPPSYVMIVFSLALVGMSILGPIVINVMAHKPEYKKVVCPAGMEIVYAQINYGSYIEILDDSSIKRTWLPTIRKTDFNTGIADFINSAVKSELANLKTPATFTEAFDLNKRSVTFLIFDGMRVLPSQQILAVCGTWSTNPGLADKKFLYVKSFFANPGS